MTCHLFYRAFALITALVVLAIPNFGILDQPAFAQNPYNSRPKLVLLLIADQFSYNYLARYQDKFKEGGFKFLLDHGACFTNCKYKQANTDTSCGHSIIATGAYPWSTGIVGNRWLDRRKGKSVGSVEDNQQLIGASGIAGSVHQLHGTTIGDEMKLVSNSHSRVFSLSLKEHPALLLAGHLANSAYWFDLKSGNFVTSSQYLHDLPSWAKAFNEQHIADNYFGKSWQRLLPENEYTASTRDDYQFERPITGDSNQFPHAITGGSSGPSEAFYKAFVMTPWANQLLADFAKTTIANESLGKHDNTDFLGVSFSSTDLLGHSFGPYSQETEDLVLRLDQTLANLLQYVDQSVGLNNCLIVFTADHGIVPIPEFLKEKGLDAGRIDPQIFTASLNALLSARLGNEEWVQAFDPPNLYLNLDAIDKLKFRQPDVEALASKLARSTTGIGETYTAVQFFLNQLPVGPHTEAVKKNYFWGRSGEVVIIPKPGYTYAVDLKGTNHCSPYSYDAQVPLIFCGSDIISGKWNQEVSPADISATISSILGIQYPSLCEGHAINEIIKQEYGPVKPLTSVSNK